MSSASQPSANIKIGIVGGGPAALFLIKEFCKKNNGYLIDIFERQQKLGIGMPYSTRGANEEHITNVSANEIPNIKTSVGEWVKTISPALQKKYGINPETFNEYKVFPRLFFGEYLSGQFELLLKEAKSKGLNVAVRLNTPIKDVEDDGEKITVVTEADERFSFDHIIISTGHTWPLVYEGKIPGYFDSPYPPSKLRFHTNKSVAIRGSSLTAIDAVRTLSREHGIYSTATDGSLIYQLSEQAKGFRMVLYSIDGLLPALRFHLEDSHLEQIEVLTAGEIQEHISQNEGFLSLDFIFERNFKKLLREKDPAFYERVKGMAMEDFVNAMMDLREKLDPFTLFKAEYAEAEKSIRRKESVYWKELLAVLSFTMNYPAKYFSAEDMLRLKKTLQPLISVVIAFVPQGSAQELIALHDAGILDIVAVDRNCTVEAVESGGVIIHYTDDAKINHSEHHNIFIDAVGQRPVAFHNFPFKNLLENKVLSQADLKFRDEKNGEQYISQHKEDAYKTSSGDYYLKVPGIKINDYFEVVDNYGAANPRLYLMAVPYIAGYNPDYSGLDFCEEASGKIVERLKVLTGLSRPGNFDIIPVGSF